MEREGGEEVFGCFAVDSDVEAWREKRSERGRRGRASETEAGEEGGKEGREERSARESGCGEKGRKSQRNVDETRDMKREVGLNAQETPKL